MIRRLFKTGNSVVLSLPQEVLDEMGIREGENVNLEWDQEQHRVIITLVESSLATLGVNEAFAHQVDDFFQQYHSALEELAK
jgi:antitoxin MazE